MVQNERRRIPIPLPKDESGEILWKKVDEYVKSGESLAQKHAAVDRLLKEIHEKEERLEQFKQGLRERFEQEKTQYVLDLEAKLKKLKEENDHLSEILKLRSSEI